MRYLDFDLEIGPSSGMSYPVQVLHSPIGPASGSMRFPFDPEELQQWLKRLQPVLDGPDEQLQRASPKDAQAAREFGQRLFAALFTDDVLDCYEQSLELVRFQHDQGVRVRLHVQAPELASLPWEYLYDPQPGDYLCLNQYTTITRSLSSTQVARPLAVQTRLRILGMVASPSDLPPLDVEHERQRIHRALKNLQAQNVVELHWVEGQTWEDLNREFPNGPWHVLHFIGHGGFDTRVNEGVLAFAKADEKMHLLTATEIGRILANHSSLRLVLLNACEGARSVENNRFASTAATLARRGIPAVVAMQYSISDQASLEWTRAFYEALATASPVDAATASARLHMSLTIPNSLEWVTPVLYMQATDGALFDLSLVRPRAVPAPATLEGPLFDQKTEPAAPRLPGVTQETMFPGMGEKRFFPHVPGVGALSSSPTAQVEEAVVTQDPLRSYLSKIQETYNTGVATEHSYRGPLGDLLNRLAPSGVQAINEPKRERHGAPDFRILHTSGENTFTLGYLEAKDIGTDLNEIQRSEQLQRYLKAIPNLVLTNHLEFRWYRQGQLQQIAQFASRRAKAVFDWSPEGAALVENLLREFLRQSVESVRQPRELAERMAGLARLIRGLIIQAFEEDVASDTLRDLHTAFKEVLIPDLKVEDFADMFAQTLAYGLFAARHRHTSDKPFSRQDAAHEIPRTNPFLRRLFGTITGNALDQENFIRIVDDLAQLLAVADMQEVLRDFGKRTRQEDPIVHFYETFLAAYDPKLRELRGVYYTPEPVVSYLVRSVDHLLKTHFDCPKGLADTSTVKIPHTDERGKIHSEELPKVLLLDPACGTGTFTYAVIDLIRDRYRQQGQAGMWSKYVRESLLPRLFSFELLMAPYAVAHLKLGMQLAALDLPQEDRATWAYDFQGNDRLGIYLTNTLEEAAKRSDMLMARYISDEANEAARVKKDYPVMVVLGNPPYSGHSANKGEWITNLLHGKDGESDHEVGNYFKVDGQPLGERNPKWLNDDYVKFLRFAQWRIERTGHGILAFITNHGYLDNPTFRGMRQSLMQTFDDIYVLNLHGNSKKQERAPDGSADENVFDIQQGVAIGVFVRRKRERDAAHAATVHHADLWGNRAQKYQWLVEEERSVASTVWVTLNPHSPFYLFVPQDTDLRAEYEQGWKATEAMPVNGWGIATRKDYLLVNFSREVLIKRFQDIYRLDAQEAIAKYEIQESPFWNLAEAKKHLSRDTENHVRTVLFRPFDKRFIYYEKCMIERGDHRYDLMSHMFQQNLCFITVRRTEVVGTPNHFFCTNDISVLHSTSAKEGNFVFPLYLYPDTTKGDLWGEDARPHAPGGRRPNFAPGFTRDFAEKLGMTWVEDGKGDRQQTFGPEDVFAYMYAVFHSPTYRERYAEFLKSDFPRLPLTSNPDLFRSLCALGDELVRLHLLEGEIAPITHYPIGDGDVVDAVRYTPPGAGETAGRVWINLTQYFEGVPPEVWEFHVGGYQVCEKWLKDRKGRPLSLRELEQYQQIVAALAATIRLMKDVDEAIEEHGGWPIS